VVRSERPGDDVGLASFYGFSIRGFQAPVMVNRPEQLRFVRFVRRHRVGIQDLAFVALVVLAAGYFFDVYDIFVAPGATPVANKIDLGEMFLLGLILTVGLLLFAARQLHMQRIETQRRLEVEHQIRQLALQDPLTGLANRRSFNDALKAAVAAPPRAEGSHALFALDLNGFKKINDLYGHGAGDEALTIVAQRLVAATRAGDVVARVGGDEFAILAQHLAGAEAATGIARRIMDGISAPIIIGDVQHQLSTGVGICLFPFEGSAAEEIIRRADVAMYKAKGDRESTMHFFDQEMDRHVREREMLERELRAAIANSDIRPYFQPLIDLKTKQISGFETLARWEHASLGEVPASRFIPIAEYTGLISRLTDQLLGVAAKTAMTWPAGVRLSFNISPVELQDRKLCLRVLSILNTSRLPPRRLEIEITESALVQDLAAAQGVLGSLRDMGIRIALDDFGTGYSSLYHLRNFKIDTIKIDRSFIQSMGIQRESAQIVSALLGLGKGLGLTVVAEGVESPDQETALAQQGCQEGQGFLFGEAVSAERSHELFAQTRRAP
jgi:diguanylate cyclase (GGDEF)-like protein